jgi:hypothetical protein
MAGGERGRCRYSFSTKHVRKRRERGTKDGTKNKETKRFSTENMSHIEESEHFLKAIYIST